jgi:geranylgeranyl diphosphate synthase type I
MSWEQYRWEQYLKECREMLESELRIIQFGDDRLAEAMRHLPFGKMLRPSILMASCEAAGGKRSLVVRKALAVEMIHQFTLIHDDIIDNSDFRRGVESVHKKFGTPLAICAGDGLFAKAFDLFCEGWDTKVLHCARLLAESTFQVVRGEAMDIQMSLELEKATEEQYLQMISLKTASLFRVSAEIGAILGGGDRRVVECLSQYGWNFGMAFQIRDDLQDILHIDPTKPSNDIREKKPILCLIRGIPPEERAVLKQKSLSPEDVEEIRRRISGEVGYAKALMEKYASQAKAQLSKIPKNRGTEFLSGVLSILKR